jgi:cytochrome oxidase Cu insertion factor (SCO1/SenC/PrrC family)
MNHNLQLVRGTLGDRVGKDVHLISIGVDPIIDTTALRAPAPKCRPLGS